MSSVYINNTIQSAMFYCVILLRLEFLGLCLLEGVPYGVYDSL